MTKSLGLPFSPASNLLIKQLDLEKIPPPTPTTEDILTSREALSLIGEMEMETISPAEILLHPGVLPFFSAYEIGRLTQLSSYFRTEITDNANAGAWYNACTNFSSTYKLYLPVVRLSEDKDSWRSIFFSLLLVSKSKWADTNDDDAAPAQDFKINVAARFRPGERKEKAVLLPLHQRLKLLRKQRREAQAGGEHEYVMLGEKMPEEFLDPLMGNLMLSPVKLPTSGKVVDRKVILAHLKRDPRDPFNNISLDMSMLISDVELKEKISEFNDKKKVNNKDNNNDNFKVASNDIKALTSEGGDITQELLSALLEADRLENSLKALNEEINIDACKVQKEKGEGGGNKNEETGEHNNDNDNNASKDASRSTALMEPLANMEAKKSEKAKEADLEQIINQQVKKEARILAVEKSRAIMLVGGLGIRPFLFDGGCYGGSTAQASLYSRSGKYSVMSALNGFNACLLAYGQTGSGKTHTIFGPEGIINSALQCSRDSEQRGESVSQIAKSVENCCKGEAGLAIRACCELAVGLKLDKNAAMGGDNLYADNNFENLSGGMNNNVGNSVRGSLSVQYVQIYNEKISCLLGSDQAVNLRGDVLSGARTVAITSIVDLMNLLSHAESNKMRAATAMNDRSSRSHSVLIFNILQTDENTNMMVKSTLHLVDLAGSERLKKSKVEGVHKKEAIGINGSLLVLGKCISALVEKKRHVPYYESKLTTLLRQCFGGNSRTTAMMCARMDDDHGNETLQSLRFGERCAAVSNMVASKATNAKAAVEAIEKSLKICEETLEGLRGRGLTHLPTYAGVEEKYKGLLLKKGELFKKSG